MVLKILICTFLYFYSYFIIRKEDWLRCFGAVSAKLDIKEKMQLDNKLVIFLKKKNRTEILREKMNIWELFEPILPNIRELYDKKLSERELDDLDEDGIFCGVNVEDGLFYSNSFLPTALVDIYLHWLDEEVLKEDIYSELFSLGTGAMTMTLVPEVSIFCKECAEKSLNDGQIRQLNLTVFKKQISHKFLDPAFLRFFNKEVDCQMRACELSADEDETNMCNPFVIDEDQFDIVGTNPFDSSSEDDEELFLDGCEFCYQTFPNEEFLKFHKRIFHSNALATKFVENAEELMLSISEGPETEAVELSPSQPKRKVQQNSKKTGNKANEKIERSVKSKYKLRKCLKY